MGALDCKQREGTAFPSRLTLCFITTTSCCRESCGPLPVWAPLYTKSFSNIWALPIEGATTKEGNSLGIMFFYVISSSAYTLVYHHCS